jgi:hypothetical protein
VKITQRLEDRARTAARAARDLGRRPLGRGPQAVYARILDGERLWLALDADAGEPALRRTDTREVVQPADDLPAGHSAHEPGVRSVRWLLTDVVPEADGAEVEVIVRPAAGAAALSILAPEPHPESPARVDTTPDGRWRFVLDSAVGDTLRVRRVPVPPSSRLRAVSAGPGSVTVVCEDVGRDQADLLLLDDDRQVAARLPMDRTAAGFERTIRTADLPALAGGYRVVLGSPEDYVLVVRQHSDLHVPDPTAVLLPMLTHEDGDRVSGRLRFAPHGALRVQRLASDAKEDG